MSIWEGCWPWMVNRIWQSRSGRLLWVPAERMRKGGIRQYEANMHYVDQTANASHWWRISSMVWSPTTSMLWNASCMMGRMQADSQIQMQPKVLEQIRHLDQHSQSGGVDQDAWFVQELRGCIWIPHMSAEAVLNKFDKVEKLKEDLSKLLKQFQAWRFAMFRDC